MANTSKRWKKIDREYADIVRLIKMSACAEERARHIARFFEYCETVLGEGNPDEEIKVFFEVAYLLGSRVCDEDAWIWINAISIAARPIRQKAMKEALLSLIPEKPIHSGDFEHLWKMWANPKTRWAVLAAYELHPNQFRKDAIKIGKKCQISSEPILHSPLYLNWIERNTKPIHRRSRKKT